MKSLITLMFSALIALPSMGQLVINEVLYDPSNNALDGDANGDGVYSQEDDAFIEFVNTSATNMDVSGYQLWDDTTSGQLRYVIPANTWVPPGGALVIFGGGTLVGHFGGAIVLKTDSVDGWNPNNSGEVIAFKDNTGKTILTFDSDALSNNPNESYTRFPDVTGAFIQHGDTTSVLFSPGTRTDGTPFDTNYVVSAISVQGQGGATTISTDGATLQMEAVVMPTFAADTTVSWSVDDMTVASISASGVLTPAGNGTVIVQATANDGTGISDSVSITITNQTISINEDEAFGFVIYPNPVQDVLKVSADVEVTNVSIISISGQLMNNVTISNGEVVVSELSAGIYILRALVNGVSVEQKFIVK